MTLAPASTSPASTPGGDADQVLAALVEISRERGADAGDDAAFALIGVALRFIGSRHGPAAALRALVPYAENLEQIIMARRAAEPKITPASWI